MTNTAPPLVIRRATRDDHGQLVKLLAEAFFPGPVADWLVPNETARRTVYRDYFHIWTEHALQYGIVDTVKLGEDVAGVALWYDMRDPIPEPGEGGRLAAACGRWWRRFDLLGDIFAEHHPTLPHYYLAFLAVTPGRQRQGIGSALLDYHHAYLATHGLPAYLEASNSRNRDLYLRHGYRTDGPVHLPENGPPIWPMHLHPAAAGEEGAGR
ncbi:GNAT family N-acetyltransferase [Plantactinospora mayteni]|uniref:N-acetyltransferase n=1 Tax=Plantactinospora mayteni TaxID=566021 RepID=A0ABQ4EIH1_9ACTN|nr:GNAT family N-acetyltransferase [Plantactinospora mayteni]GIG94538.1 N-acetyltransferase [Plantactinospora mayteni]